ncbi:MAG: DUF2164 family protein [Lachnospirales bacterium]
MKKKKDEEFLLKKDKEACALLLQNYFLENFDHSLSGLQSDILVDFIGENMGKYFYNKGVEDAIIAIKDKADDLYLLMKD